VLSFVPKHHRVRIRRGWATRPRVPLQVKGNCRSLDCDARHRFAMEEEATRVSARDDRLGLGARDGSLETGVKGKSVRQKRRRVEAKARGRRGRRGRV